MEAGERQTEGTEAGQGPQETEEERKERVEAELARLREELKEAGSWVEEGGVISRRGVGEDSPREGGGAVVDMEETTEEDLVWLEEAREEEGLGKSVEYEEHMEVRVLRYDSKMNNSKRFLLGVTVGLTRGAELDGGVLPGEYEEG